MSTERRSTTRTPLCNPPEAVMSTADGRTHLVSGGERAWLEVARVEGGRVLLCTYSVPEDAAPGTAPAVREEWVLASVLHHHAGHHPGGPAWREWYADAVAQLPPQLRNLTTSVLPSPQTGPAPREEVSCVTRLHRQGETRRVYVATRPYPGDYAVGGRGGYTVWVDERMVGDEYPTPGGAQREADELVAQLERNGWRRT